MLEGTFPSSKVTSRIVKRQHLTTVPVAFSFYLRKHLHKHLAVTLLLALLRSSDQKAVPSVNKKKCISRLIFKLFGNLTSESSSKQPPDSKDVTLSI